MGRQTDYYTGVVGLVPLAKDKDRVLFVSRLGDLSVILHRGAAPKLAKIAFRSRPGRPAVARQNARCEGIGRASTKYRCGLEKLLRFADPKGTTIENFKQSADAAPVSQPTAVGPTKFGHISFMIPDIVPE